MAGDDHPLALAAMQRIWLIFCFVFWSDWGSSWLWFVVLLLVVLALFVCMFVCIFVYIYRFMYVEVVWTGCNTDS